MIDAQTLTCLASKDFRIPCECTHAIKHVAFCNKTNNKKKTNAKCMRYRTHAH